MILMQPIMMAWTERGSEMLRKDDKYSLVHALHHLESNEIDDPDGANGWYCGNKEQFIARHIKAKKLLRELIGKAARDE